MLAVSQNTQPNGNAAYNSRSVIRDVKQIRKVTMAMGNYTYKRDKKDRSVYAIARLHVHFGDDWSTPGNMYQAKRSDVLLHDEAQWEIKRDDSIHKILLWANEVCVTGIQFHMVSGIISPSFGSVPAASATMPTETIVVQPHEVIVGVFGHYSGVLNSFGITTGVVVNNNPYVGSAGGGAMVGYNKRRFVEPHSFHPPGTYQQQPGTYMVQQYRV